MNIYFDTEFTGLHKNTTLISIGLVDEDGKSFYAIFNDYDRKQCDKWIQDNVIKHLNLVPKEELDENGNFLYRCTGGEYWVVQGNKEHIKKYLTEWLEQYDKIQLISDVCHYDMVLFIDIFGGAFDIPENVSPVCHDICQDIADKFMLSDIEAFNYSREELLTYYHIDVKGEKHNSLYDALVIKELYKAMNN